jgi:hypothetical protein
MGNFSRIASDAAPRRNSYFPGSTMCCFFGVSRPQSRPAGTSAVTRPDVTSKTHSTGASAAVSTLPIAIVHSPAGRWAMLTVKCLPWISLRNASAWLPAPSMTTDAASLWRAQSPLALTCGPHESQMSSAANAAGAQGHRLATHPGDTTTRGPVRATGIFLSWVFIRCEPPLMEGTVAACKAKCAPLWSPA